MWVWLTFQLLSKIFGWNSAHLSKMIKLWFLIKVLIEIQKVLGKHFHVILPSI